MASIVNYLNNLSFKTELLVGSPTQAKENGTTFAAAVLAYRTFWGLGERWWMQIIDGAQHKKGPLVFDTNGRKPEPGYLDKIREGCVFAANCLQDPLTPELYKDIHKRSVTQLVIQKISQENVGRFNPARYWQTYASHLLDFELRTEKKVLEDDENYQKMKKISNAKEFVEDPTLIPFAKELIGIETSDAEIVEIVKNAEEKVVGREKKVTQRLIQINQIIQQRSQDLGLAKPLCRMYLDHKKGGLEQNIITEYSFYEANEKEVEQIVKRIFDVYESKMEKTKDPNKKLELIAEMYQTLEWLHPFKDGQGRTTLILLAKELCRHGFNPPILDLPYFSETATLAEWTNYLREGMIEWLNELAAPHRHTAPADAMSTTEEVVAIYYV